MSYVVVLFCSVRRQMYLDVVENRFSLSPHLVGMRYQLVVVDVVRSVPINDRECVIRKEVGSQCVPWRLAFSVHITPSCPELPPAL